MKVYEQLAKKITFSLYDVTAITGNESTSTSLISRWLKKKYLVRIRKNLYTCIDLATGDVIANKYQIATAINKDSYVSHHTAFEFYGMANQVFNTVYVSSKQRFGTFEFMGNRYKYVNSDFKDGVIKVKNIEGIEITDKERTFIDSVNLVSKIGGYEELIKITEMIEDLNEAKLIHYLEMHNKKFLYQKTGYFLEQYYYGEQLEFDFFSLCHSKAGKSVRYLIQGQEGKFDKNWNLVIPLEFNQKKDGQGEVDEYI